MATINSLDIRTRPSAFRAIATFNQPVTALGSMKLIYGVREFDLNNEYNSGAISTFVPKQRGVYSIVATANFVPTTLNESTSITIEIRVNNVLVASSSEVWNPPGGIGGGSNTIEVNTISRLQAQDRVEVFFSSTRNGTIFQSSPFSSMGTTFQAARFPSP